jgi:hypothetical protein
MTWCRSTRLFSRKEAVGHKNPERSAEAARTQAATAVAAPAPGGDRGHPDCEGDSGRNGHYCTVPQVVRVSPGRENGTKRSLGVWAPAASCGVIRSSPQVREYQVRERSAPNTATADVSLAPCKTRIEGVQGGEGGATAAQQIAKRLGCMRPPPVGWAKPPKTVGQPQPDAPDTSSKPWIS